VVPDYKIARAENNRLNEPVVIFCLILLDFVPNFLPQAKNPLFLLQDAAPAFGTLRKAGHCVVWTYGSAKTHFRVSSEHEEIWRDAQLLNDGTIDPALAKHQVFVPITSHLIGEYAKGNVRFAVGTLCSASAPGGIQGDGHVNGPVALANVPKDFIDKRLPVVDKNLSRRGVFPHESFERLRHGFGACRFQSFEKGVPGEETSNAQHPSEPIAFR